MSKRQEQSEWLPNSAEDSISDGSFERDSWDVWSNLC